MRKNWGVSGRWETERGDEAVGLGALERADGANFSVFEKSLLKLIWILENINIVEN